MRTRAIFSIAATGALALFLGLTPGLARAQHNDQHGRSGTEAKTDDDRKYDKLDWLETKEDQRFDAAHRQLHQRLETERLRFIRNHQELKQRDPAQYDREYNKLLGKLKLQHERADNRMDRTHSKIDNNLEKREKQQDKLHQKH